MLEKEKTPILASINAYSLNKKKLNQVYRNIPKFP